MFRVYFVCYENHIEPTASARVCVLKSLSYKNDTIINRGQFCEVDMYMCFHKSSDHLDSKEINLP